MSKKKLIVGTRSSQLALWQADFVIGELRKRYPDLAIEKRLMTTKGDKILNAPLAKIGGKGLFTKELETAMLAGEIDIAVHSLKDMPVVVPEGLVITAVTERADAGDALVSQRYGSFGALPEGAKVGTSSLRRRAQLLHARPDLQIVDLRGNVNTRLRKLEEENFDGIILACAGLKRLGFGERIRQVLPRSLCLPAVGQGALAIESRIDDRETRELLSFLDDGITRACTAAERGFLATVEGGCQVPVGVYAQPVNNADILQDAHAGKAEAIRVEAVIASLDGRKLFRDSVEGAADEAENLGISLANKLLDMGGREILRSLGIEL
ncbi:hydroxymethylbilane synthase [Veillonellaceae bacterium WCA-693-APC-5D-A]|uniref:Porphobilinogen deaminase n=1 Tax=Anaerovibrio slackiae TaxID=2652309 RepID=A0A6I2UH85_9FIRM|nr:hydroxymethylbilane synthase [Anaerovibrio slackiae]MSU09079.1 hydroxymethylbilane synthase [Anaerovibrio slackiae]